MKLLHFKTEKNKPVDMTGEILAALKEAGVSSGAVQVEACDLDVGVSVLRRDTEPLLQDMMRAQRDLVPALIGFKYEDSPDTTAGMLRASMFGRSATLLLDGGKLVCGDASVYLVDYNGPCDRAVMICALQERQG